MRADNDEDGKDDGSDEESTISHVRDDREVRAQVRVDTGEHAAVAPPYSVSVDYGRERYSVAGPSTLSVKDVKDALKTFSGNGTQNVRR